MKKKFIPQRQLDNLNKRLSPLGSLDRRFWKLRNGNRPRQCQLALAFIIDKAYKDYKHNSSQIKMSTLINQHMLSKYFGSLNITNLFILFLIQYKFIQIKTNYFHSNNINQKHLNKSTQYYINTSIKYFKTIDLQITEQQQQLIHSRQLKIRGKYEQQLYVYSIQTNDYLTASHPNINNKTGNLKIDAQTGQLLLLNKEQSDLFSQRMKEWQLDKDLLLKGLIKQFDHIKQFTLDDFLNQNIIFKTRHQVSLYYKIKALLTQKYHRVIVGQRGGRIHHLLCNAPTWLWQCIVSKDKDKPRIAIDLVSAQIIFFVQQVGMKLPKTLQQKLVNGQFYQELNKQLYNNKMTRRNTKQIVFSKLFNNHKSIWNKFKQVFGKQGEQFYKAYIIKYNQLKKDKVKMAARLQRKESDLFNAIFKKYTSTLIRYDQVITSNQWQVECILKEIYNYVGYKIPVHIKYNQQKSKLI